MESKGFALIEMLVFTGAALGFGIWQYVSVSRELKKTRAEDARKDERPEV
jgi:hypothetical protein